MGGRQTGLKFTPVGGEFESGGRTYIVVPRGGVAVPREACRGCWFWKEQKTCPGQGCSSFERKDRKSVWFVRKEEVI